MTEVIINNYFSNKKKRVSFCNDVKDFDGSSDFNSNFFLLCIRSFDPLCKFGKKIETSFDVIDFLHEEKLTIQFILYSLNELVIAKSKIIDLDRKHKFDSICKILIESKAFSKFRKEKGGIVYRNIEEIEDELYWNHDFWIARCNKHNIRKNTICILRKGSRDFQINIGIKQIKYIDGLIKLLEETLLWFN